MGDVLGDESDQVSEAKPLWVIAQVRAVLAVQGTGIVSIGFRVLG